MAKVSTDFHKGYVTALNHVHQLIAAHVEALQNGGQPTVQPMLAPPSAGPSANVPAPAPTRPTPAFPYGRPVG